MDTPPDKTPNQNSEYEENLRAAQERLKPLYERPERAPESSILSRIIDDYLKAAHERDKNSSDTEE